MLMWDVNREGYGTTAAMAELSNCRLHRFKIPMFQEQLPLEALYHESVLHLATLK
jgi:hypothetical protein